MRTIASVGVRLLEWRKAPWEPDRTGLGHWNLHAGDEIVGTFSRLTHGRAVAEFADGRWTVHPKHRHGLAAIWSIFAAVIGTHEIGLQRERSEPDFGKVHVSTGLGSMQFANGHGYRCQPTKHRTSDGLRDRFEWTLSDERGSPLVHFVCFDEVAIELSISSSGLAIPEVHLFTILAPYLAYSRQYSQD